MTHSISIITPSFNQAVFIERTINSVLNQDYKNIEYVIVDGASTDNTVDILKKYQSQLRWVSERDRGQTHAINKGIQMTSGDIIGWLNSDDIYFPNALNEISAIFNNHPEIDVIYGDAFHIDTNDNFIEKYNTEQWNINRLKDFCFISQPAVFFRRKVVERFGLLDEHLNYCMDYEYWLRLGLQGAQFHHLNVTLAGSRLHSDTKTLSARVKVHKEINNMLKKKLGKVPECWLRNYAHALVESKEKYQNNTTEEMMKTAISWQTLFASLRWNKALNQSFLKKVRSWLT